MEENPWGQSVQVCESIPGPCICVCVCPCTRMVITYNHPECLYCTNSITMLTEWLCGMGIAGVVNGPGRSVISPAQGQAQINMQLDKATATANTLCLIHANIM